VVHPCRAIQHRAEVVHPTQLGFTDRQPHPHRQLQRPLRGHSGIDRGPRRGERHAHSVTGVLEQPAPMRLDRSAQHLAMRGQRCSHRIGVGLPPTGGTLNIGEQKRHNPRRCSRWWSGHPHRISQQTSSYLARHRNPARDRRPEARCARGSNCHGIHRPTRTGHGSRPAGRIDAVRPALHACSSGAPRRSAMSGSSEEVNMRHCISNAAVG